MMSLFQSFDLGITFNSILYPFVLLALIFMNFYKNSFLLNSLNYFLNLFSSFFLSLKPKSYTKSMIFFVSMIMMSLGWINFSSVMGYNFPITSQVCLVLFISLTIWFSFNLFFMFNNSKGFLSHCVPEGTPIYLTWFLFIIEIISNIIRPLTLTVRLVANIVAGHLLMILLSKLVINYSFFVSLVYTGLNVVEFFVALIQAYIYSTMISLYFSELH